MGSNIHANIWGTWGAFGPPGPPNICMYITTHIKWFASPGNSGGPPAGWAPLRAWIFFAKRRKFFYCKSNCFQKLWCWWKFCFQELEIEFLKLETKFQELETKLRQLVCCHDEAELVVCISAGKKQPVLAWCVVCKQTNKFVVENSWCDRFLKLFCRSGQALALAGVSI